MAGIFADCGQKCRSRRHQLDLNAAITKGNLREVQAYFSLCNSAGQLSDTLGRFPLHVASTCSKLDIVEWLINEKHADLGIKDQESGWTALHRAIFYGQIPIARLLLQVPHNYDITGSSFTITLNFNEANFTLAL